MDFEFGSGFRSGRRGRFFHGSGPWGFAMGFGPMWVWAWEGGYRSYRSKRALLRELEAYREALEEELAEVAREIEELKRELGEE